MRAFPVETLAERAARLAAHFTVVLPPGEGPFPVCVMLHGCGKADGPQPGYAEALARAGVASVIVDSFTPRGLDRAGALALVCSGLMLRGSERMGDLFAAAHWLVAQPWADQSRIAAAGWSHGGWTVMDALAVDPADWPRRTWLVDVDLATLDGLRHVFAVYPWCGPGSRTGRHGWMRPVAATLVVAGRDTVSGVRLPRAAIAAARRSGAPVEEVFLEDATHSFDEHGVADPRFRYDQALVDAAHALCADRLSRALLG
jgi:dienelactone hydrolase